LALPVSQKPDNGKRDVFYDGLRNRIGCNSGMHDSIVDVFRGTGFAIAAAAGGWWTVFAPVLMTLLL
jgi:hypothetical protein